MSPKSSDPNMVEGIILIYHHTMFLNAPTIMEHVNSFDKYLHYPVWVVNTEFGFPPGLAEMEFRVVILHYSLFGTKKYMLPSSYLDFIERAKKSYKIAFFQDEYRYCQQRFDFIRKNDIDCIYTLLEPQNHKEVYGQHTDVSHCVYTLPGYADDEMIAKAKNMWTPDLEREIDISYRARPLPFFMGKGAQEKAQIGIEFKRRNQNLGLLCDIETAEYQRLYGNKWHELLSNSRAFLGVEAGVSIFDIQDSVRIEYEQLLRKNPTITFDEVSEILLEPWENNIFYRTISPRHFEAAAFRVCQILFEGKYSGILHPMIHYIPLKKDWSNFDEVIERFRDPVLRQELTENAYNDLIASDRFSYRQFIADFENHLVEAGVKINKSDEKDHRVTDILERGYLRRWIWALIRSLPHYPFPGRKSISRIVKRIMRFLAI
jgi:hypothetical protein